MADAKNDKDKLTKASAAVRLKDIGRDRRSGGPTNEDADERKELQACLKLTEHAADLGTKLKTAQETLNTKVAAQYGQLTVDEIRTLVVEEVKQLAATVAAHIQKMGTY